MNEDEPSVGIKGAGLALDVNYSYRIAKQIEDFKSHPLLGYRTSGSRAEANAGLFIMREMERIGLNPIREKISVDGWEFGGARLTFDSGGKTVTAELGGYQTDFVTCGKRKFLIADAGRGTAADYEGRNVVGKLVLVHINQRDEWWINYPAYEARLHGAAAVIAVQDSGYGTADSRSLNAQDICGPKDAPAFSVSRHDAAMLVSAMRGGEIEVEFEASSVVTENTETYNITGTIPGISRELIVVSAHYDSYFNGFQDDNAGVAMMLSVAAAIVKSGVVPRKTLKFCAFAAEEWGLIDCRYDWSRGAYRHMTDLHPEWAGSTFADVNIELPAYLHGTRHTVRCAYELKDFLKGVADEFSDFSPYSARSRVVCPVQTWSDDFSMAVCGVPSMVNDFASGSFMETHYHSQFDSDDFYDRAVYDFHHRFYAEVIAVLDAAATVPLNFTPRIDALTESVKRVAFEFKGRREFFAAAESARQAAVRLFAAVNGLNAAGVCDRDINGGLLAEFKLCEDRFVRLDWYENAVFPHENHAANVENISIAAEHIRGGRIPQALEYLAKVDDNSYCLAFSRETVEYFAERAKCDRGTWGSGRLTERVDLFSIIADITRGDCAESVVAELDGIAERQRDAATCDIARETAELSAMSGELNELHKKIIGKFGAI